MIELIGAAFVCVAVLTPSLALLRGSVEMSARLELRQTMQTLAESRLDFELAMARQNFTNSVEAGDLRDDGHRELRWQATRTQTAAGGGIPGRLLAVSVQVWHDQDGDRRPGNDEPIVSLAAKLARGPNG